MSEPITTPKPAIDESRLLEIRHEAERLGLVQGAGIRPAGAPFPQASPQTGYYGIPLLKEPQWNWAIPLYFFVGGTTGSAGVIASLADWTGGDRKLARQARLMAVGGAMLSGAFLVYDLGRPARFLNMLRVFKPQSPMSMGAWILTAFSASSAAALFADLVSNYWNGLPVRIIGGTGKLFSTIFGMPFSNYTGVLIGATAIPVWNSAVESLPIHFGMSGLQAATSLLELMGHDDSTALNLLGLFSSALETLEGLKIERKNHPALKPLKQGASGWITRAGGALSGPVPLALRAAAVLSGSRNARRWAAWSGIAGSLLTRYGWMRAGHASARDWRLPLETQESPRTPSSPRGS